MSEATKRPWFLSGVRFRMNNREWLSINRYDEAKKQDENLAIVGYDPRNGDGSADATFIVTAVNNHDALVAALERAERYIAEGGLCPLLTDVRAVLVQAKGAAS